MDEHWRHEPPCEKGGYTEVSRLVMADECCPLCGVALIPPESVRRMRQEREEIYERLAAGWKPRTPREILAMVEAGDEQ